MIHYINSYIKGFYDSINIFKVFYTVLEIKECRKLFSKMVFVNVFLFFLTYISLDKFCNFNNLNCDSIIYFFWIYPLLPIIYCLNIKYQDKIIYNYFISKEKKVITINNDFEKEIAYKLWYNINFLFYILLINIFSYFPYVGKYIYFLTISLIYSYFCIDYYWDFKNISHEERFEIYEEKLIYFLGFGTIFSILKFNFDYISSFIIISLIYPLLAIKFIYTKIEKSNTQKISIFCFIFRITLKIIKYFLD